MYAMEHGITITNKHNEVSMTTRLIYNTEAEQCVIGGLILDNQSWDKLGDFLFAEDFYHKHHQILFKQIIHLLIDNKPVDWLTLATSLKASGQFEEIGGDIYIVNLIKNTPTAANIRTYAEVVKRCSQERKLFHAATQIINMINEREETVFDKAEKLILDIRESKETEPKAYNEGLSKILQDIQDRKENKGKLLGLSTGFVDLDKITKGLRKSNLIILAARPAMGKSQIALNIAEHIGIELQKTVLIFSLEMSDEQLKYRSLASLSKLSHEKIESGDLTDSEEEKLAATLPKFNDAKIFLDEASGLSVNEIRAKCRRIKRLHGLELVIVDYLGLAEGIGHNETEKVSDISRGLKLLAKELNVPVLALSQLNRGIESRENKRPTLADLRQSGQIEQDADIVMFIYRHEVYHPETPAKNIAEIIISKNRSGRTGKVYLTFAGDRCKFENYFGEEPNYNEVIAKNFTKGFKPNLRDYSYE